MNRTAPIRDEDFWTDRARFLHEVAVCLATGIGGPIEVAHIRYEDAWFGKHDAGMALKPGDQWTVPLSKREHEAQHAQGERGYWRSRGFDTANASTSPLSAAAVITQFQLSDAVDPCRVWIMERAYEAKMSLTEV